MFFEKFAFKTVNAWDEEVYALTSAGYVLLGIIFLALLFTAQALAKRDSKRSFSAKQLVFMAMAMAISTVTSEIKLIHMPMGGSVTALSMFFITQVGYWYGPKAGILTGVAHGILQLMLGPQIYSLPQLLVDYPLAFGALGLSGFMCNKRHGLQSGYLLAVAGRYVFAFLSGWLFFAYYAPEGWNGAVYSAVYNICYIGLEGLITVILISLSPMQKAICTIKEMALGER